MRPVTGNVQPHNSNASAYSSDHGSRFEELHIDFSVLQGPAHKIVLVKTVIGTLKKNYGPAELNN